MTHDIGSTIQTAINTYAKPVKQRAVRLHKYIQHGLLKAAFSLSNHTSEATLPLRPPFKIVRIPQHPEMGEIDRLARTRPRLLQAERRVRGLMHGYLLLALLGGGAEFAEDFAEEGAVGWEARAHNGHPQFN